MLSVEPSRAHDLKIASVDAGKIFSHWDYTIRFEDKMKSLRNNLESKDRERSAVIKQLIQKQRSLSAKYEKSLRKISGEQKLQMNETYKNLGREIKALQRDRLDYIKRENIRLREMSQSTSQSILTSINEAVQVFAKQHNYDMVIESKGETTANLPFFLHLEGAVDITDSIIMQLNQSHQPNSNQ